MLNLKGEISDHSSCHGLSFPNFPEKGGSDFSHKKEGVGKIGNKILKKGVGNIGGGGWVHKIGVLGTQCQLCIYII